MDNEKLIKVDFPGMNCQIAPYESSVPLETAPGYRKLDTSISQTGQISALFQEIPTLAGAELTRKAYIVKFPKGVRGEMIKLKQGGRGTPLRDPTTGKFTGTASLYPVNTQVAVVYGFSAMSVVSGQYFLAEINQQMNRMNQSLDKILEFLYGEKRAELMAEVNFVRYAQQNYASIMEYDEQRRATLVNLQEARKVAMKDLEFYMSDLNSAVHPANNPEPVSLVDKATRTKECLELSMQLYLMSGLLEIYYSGNYDAGYLRFMEEDVSALIIKCEKRMLGDFNALTSYIETYKDKLGKKTDKAALLNQVNEIIESVSGTDESVMKKALRKALYSAEKAQEYCITADGAVYLKNA